MRAVLFGVMFLGVVTLGLRGPDSSSGSETDIKATEKKEAVEGQGNPVQPDQKIAPGEKAKETPEDKPKGASDPAGGKKAEKGTEKKSSRAETNLKKTKRSAKEDRPWLIKEHPNKKSHTPRKKPVPLKWENDAQRLQCETLLKKLQKSFDKARTYSIRGDTCATARHANGFMDLADRCNKDCPDGFLKSNGYSEKIIRNVKVLSELGKKACLDK